MPTEDNRQKLAEIAKTTSDRQELTNQLESLINDFSRVNPPTATYVQQKYPTIYKILSISTDLSKDGQIDSKVLLRLKRDLQSLDELIINTPNMIREQVTEITHEWCKNNVDGSMLIDISPSKEILGGVTCSYRGQYRDFSLDKIIKEKVYAQV